MCGRNFGNLLIPALAGTLVAETITTHQATMRQPVSQAVCPHCQTAVSSTFAWCPQCGQALRAQTKSQACAYCGVTMTANARYCSSCGAPAGKR